MKTFHYFIFAILFVLAACKGGGVKPGLAETDSTTAITESSADAGAVTPAKRYEIKSGTVVYKGPMGVIQTLYFDNYGATEVFTTELEMMGIKSKDTQIRRDGYQYSFKAGETTGVKSKWYTNDVNYTKMDVELMKQYKVKDLGSETIAGKSCKKYSAEFGSSPIVTWVWNNIMVKTITKMANTEIVIEATKIEEGPVDATLFEVPANVTFTES
jgi:hypothetical protein